MKKAKLAIFLVCILFLTISSNVFASVKINKIKILGNSFTKEGTIKSFCPEFEEKKEYESEELLQKIGDRVKSRLERSGWFYGVNIYITPSKEGEEYRNIVLEVTEGFLERFGGGSAYGMYGKDNALGGGEHYKVIMGLNGQYFEAGTKNWTRDIFVKGAVGNLPQMYYYKKGDEKNYSLEAIQDIGLELETGYRINYDLKLTLNNRFSMFTDDKYKKLFNKYVTTVKMGYDVSVNRKRGYSLEGEYNYILLFDNKNDLFINRLRLEARDYISLGDKFTTAIKVKGEWQRENNGRELLEVMKLSIAGIDGVRSLNYDNLSGELTTLISVEARYKLIYHEMFNLFTIDYSPVLFYDIGNAAKSIEANRGKDYICAYGTGLRVNMSAPIGVTLRLEEGWNRDGEGTFFFNVGAPF